MYLLYHKTLAGTIVGSGASYAVGAKVISKILGVGKVLGNAGQALSKLPLLNKLGAEGITRVLADTMLDTAIDTVPTMVEMAYEGESAESILKEGVKKTGVNIALNGAFETGYQVAGNVWDGVVKSGGDSTVDNRVVNNRFFNNGERIATTSQIRSYKQQMNSMGIDVVVDQKGRVLYGNKAAGFDYTKGTVYIKKQAGVIDLYHEGFHAEQYIKIGQEKYVNLGILAREEYVYSRIMDNFSLFNEAELQGATNYITRLRRHY